MTEVVQVAQNPQDQKCGFVLQLPPHKLGVLPNQINNIEVMGFPPIFEGLSHKQISWKTDFFCISAV